MKIAKAMGLWSLIIVIGLMGGCVSSGDEKSAGKEIQNSLVEGIEVFGTVENRNTENIVIDIPGYVAEAPLNGDFQVSRGEKILKVDLMEYNTQLQNKESELKIKKLELEKMQLNGKLVAEQIARMEKFLAEQKKNMAQGKDPDVLAAMNDYQKASASYDFLKKQYDSKKILYENKTISESEYLKAKNDYEEAQKAMENAKLKIEITKNEKTKSINELSSDLLTKKTELGHIQSSSVAGSNVNVVILMEQIDMLQRDIEALKALYAKLNIVDGWIIAQEDGVVSELKYKLGDKLVAGQTAFQFLKRQDRYVKANVPEEFIKDVAVGQTAKVTPIADKSKVYSGKVTQIYDIAEVNNGETVVPIFIKLDALDQFLLPNFNVDVEIEKTEGQGKKQ